MKNAKLAVNLINEILSLPEVQASRKAIEGHSVVEIIEHALERQFLLGALDAELGFDMDVKDLDLK